MSGDFDPEAFDRKMAQIYNDDYYAQEDAGFKPKAGGDELPAGMLEDGPEAAAGEGFDALTKRLQQSKDKKVRQTAQQYMDEYYALDFEDLIAGELPTRFK